MKSFRATFIKSGVKPEHFPPSLLPEFAFVGRSNVGKSSLLNSLVNHRNLAQTSGTPGKTRLINFFNIDDRLVFVDLPGYGYASRSKSEVGSWKRMAEWYLLAKRNVRAVFVLFDMRHPAREADALLLSWLREQGLPFHVIFTKIDKVGVTRRATHIRQNYPGLTEYHLYSSHTKQGRDELWAYIEAHSNEAPLVPPVEIPNTGNIAEHASSSLQPSDQDA